jgi:hypothetical protein
MATVYLARDTLLERDVALKVPSATLLLGPLNRERFLREGRAAARLRHPNICPILDLGEWEGSLYLTMPHVQGGSLSQCRMSSPLDATRLVWALALAMAEAHRNHVVHRDLKAENILIGLDGEPVITDFGIALLLDEPERITEPGLIIGTLGSAAPEQVEAQPEKIGIACDIFALGVILYRLLTGRMPFMASNRLDLAMQTLHVDPEPPSRHCPGLPARLESVCLKALAKRVEDRYGSMMELADALGDILGISRGRKEGPRPLVPREAVHFAFVGMGERAPDWTGPQDCVWLDVGNDLRPGIIDHHHLTAGTGSTTSLVLAYPSFLDRAVVLSREPTSMFTLVLHEKPDLDAIAAAHLAQSYLSTQSFPPGAEALARYVDEVDEGVLGVVQDRPFSLYIAYQQLANRLLQRSGTPVQEIWQNLARAGARLVSYTLEQATLHKVSLIDVDAFGCPGLFEAEDRTAVVHDLELYRRKLADPRTHARQMWLELPGQFGGTVRVEALLVRDVENTDDPERCRFFKDWARTDRVRSSEGNGFAALCVFCSEGPRQVRRAIVSVSPGSNASLRGLAALLDRAEAERRRQLFGVDDRVKDPATGASKVPRPGYDNSDPWYDGRAHRYTIVDSPRMGSLLTADAIETVFLQFGQAFPAH